MTETVIVYSKDKCPWCDKAKALLDSNNVPYKELKYNIDFSREQLAEKLPFNYNKITLPQIFIDGQNIGGYEDLLDYINLMNSIDKLKKDNNHG